MEADEPRWERLQQRPSPSIRGRFNPPVVLVGRSVAAPPRKIGGCLPGRWWGGKYPSSPFRRARPMPKPLPLRTRQIHLDFHTGPAIGDVGAGFAAREFARTMKRAHVNSVTVFAKCHHGHLYYHSKRPERHPGLKPGLDLLRGQVEALHREGIRAPIY